MDIVTVEAASRPMVYVSRTATIGPAGIARTMGEAFATLGAFIGKNGITPEGPPVAVYRMGKDGSVGIDLGFPVANAALTKVAGEIKAGGTPAGRAVKAIHHGPYTTIQATYADIAKYLRDMRLPMPQTSWEVYLSDPQKTAPKDLVTEVYFPVR